MTVAEATQKLARLGVSTPTITTTERTASMATMSDDAYERAKNNLRGRVNDDDGLPPRYQGLGPAELGAPKTEIVHMQGLLEKRQQTIELARQLEQMHKSQIQTLQETIAVLKAENDALKRHV